jgi:hypothetical protein
MIAIHPAAALELMEGAAYYDTSSPGLGAMFEQVANRLLDQIESTPTLFPSHPFATTKSVRRALFPRFPYAFAYAIQDDATPFVLAAEHLKREPGYWSARIATLDS